tara:strand:- start:427 stop:681 length:255 start_codon:yes stop_codon:yes gene_type:complete
MPKKQPKYIYTSPDGGHTVYQQEIGKEGRIKISEDEYALSVIQAQNEDQMCGWEAVQIRKKHPALQEAWNQYKTLWQLCVENNE